MAAATLLQGPESPPALDYLRDWFAELSRARGFGMNGLEPLTYQMIESWARLTDRHPEPHEVAALLGLDVAMRNPEKKREATS